MGNEPTVQPGYEVARDESGLTARERQVLGMVRAGQPQAAIAKEVGVSRARIGAIVKQLRGKGYDLTVTDGRANANRARATD